MSFIILILLEIDWDNQDTVDNQVYFEITGIKRNRDILDMSNYLVFADNKYQGIWSTK